MKNLFIITFGFYGIYIIATAVFVSFIYFYYKNKDLFFLKAFIVALASWVLGSEVIKPLVGIHRPLGDASLLNPGGVYSFPSGHTVFLLALGFYIYLRYPRPGIVLIILGLLVGIARVLGNAHTFVDIFGSFILGLIVVLVASRYIPFFRVKKEN